MNRKFILSFVMLFFCFVLQAKEFRVEQLSFEDGVSHNMVYSIIQDEQGYMWFGTMYGLIRYDGINYKKYRHNPKDSTSLSNDDVVTICEDSKNNLWIGTYGRGLNFYNRESNKFVRLGKQHFKKLLNWDGVIWDIVEDADNNIWFTTRTSGLVKLNMYSFNYEVFDSSDWSINNNHVSGLYFNPADKSLYVGTLGGVMHEFDSGTNAFNKYSIRINNDSSFIMLSAIEYDKNSIAVGTQRGLLLFDKYEHKFSKAELPEHPMLSKISVRKILLDAEKNELWLATQLGVFCINIDKNSIDRIHANNFNSNQRISSNNVVAFCRDFTGIFWAGNYMGGINKILTTPTNIKLIQHQAETDEGLTNNKVNSFAQSDDGTLWIATSDGLNELDLKSNKWKSYIKKADQSMGFNSNYISALKIDASNNMWIGTARGLNKMFVDDRRIIPLSNFTDGSSPGQNFISCLEISQDNILFVGTYNGLYEYNITRDVFSRSAHTILDNNILSLYADSHNCLWVGTYLGVNKIDLITGEIKLFSQNPTNENSISNNYVYSMIEDKSNRLWLATGGGLNLYNREDDTFAYFTESDGLSSSVITGVIIDSEGFLWLSTNMGITKFDVDKMNFTKYDTRDGLQSNMFKNNSCLKLNDGRLAFGGINGFNIIDTKDINSASNIPKATISSINVMGQETYVTDKNLELNYDENFIELNLAVLDFNNPTKNKYKYMLEGIDNSWIESDDPYLKYTNLPPGDYSLKVLGADSFGNWSSQPILKHIIIHPPFWKTYWFYGLILLGFVSLLVIYHRQRITNEIKRRIEFEKIRSLENEKVRKKAAADFHDELGHRITKISLFSEILKQHNKNLDNESLTYLNKISDMTKGLSSGVRDFIWTLDPDNDSLYEVAIRLKDFGDELFDKTGVSFTVEGISSEFENVKLSMDWRRHLTLMFKEAMNNALKYAQARNVSLRFEFQRETISLELNDDGKGIDAEHKAGNGLNNIKTRANYLNSKLDIITGMNSGTSVKFVGAFPH